MREKFFIFVFVFVVLVVIIFPMLRAQTENQREYRANSAIDYRELRNADIDEIIETYHETMNEKINERIEWMLSATPEESRERERVPLRNVSTGKLPACPEKNTSTFCVAKFLVEEYTAFREELLDRSRKTLREAQDSASSADPEDIGDIQSLVRESDDIISKINREIAVSEKTVDMTLAAYYELHLAWPLHKKYEEVISAMSEYRENLADMRDSIEKFPNTFHNVSTTQCT